MSGSATLPHQSHSSSVAPTSGLGVEDASIEGLLGDIQSAEVLRGVEDELKWLLNSKVGMVTGI